MRQSHIDDSIDAFTLELLRSGYALTNLVSEIGDALEQNPECDEDAISVFEMISGSIRTFLAEAEPAGVDAATTLISGAMDRVFDHLHTAVELRRRMDAGDPIVRGYDDPMLALAGSPEPGEAAEPAPAKPAPEDPGHDLAIELVDCAPMFCELFDGMAAWVAQAPPSVTPFPEGAHNFLRVLIDELDGRYSDAELTSAAAILRDLAHALTNDVYELNPDFQDPDFQDPDFQDPGLEDPDFQDPDFQDPDFQDPGLEDSELD